MDTILQILAYTTPSVVVFLTAIYLIRQFLTTEERKRIYELRVINQKAALPVKLQAYERLTLFLERISPQNMIHRLRRKGMTAQQLHYALVKDIRHEFEHNLSQQIYISPSVWNMIATSKEEMITIINRVAQTIPPEASEKELSQKIFSYIMEQNRGLPMQKAIDALKEEVRRLI